MSDSRLKQILSDCCNDVTFSFNGQPCGIFPSVEESKVSYSAWYGDDNKRFYSVDDIMKSDFFGGELLEEIEKVVDMQAN